MLEMDSLCAGGINVRELVAPRVFLRSKFWEENWYDACDEEDSFHPVLVWTAKV